MPHFCDYSGPKFDEYEKLITNIRSFNAALRVWGLISVRWRFQLEPFRPIACAPLEFCLGILRKVDHYELLRRFRVGTWLPPARRLVRRLFGLRIEEIAPVAEILKSRAAKAIPRRSYENLRAKRMMEEQGRRFLWLRATSTSQEKVAPPSKFRAVNSTRGRNPEKEELGVFIGWGNVGCPTPWRALRGTGAGDFNNRPRSPHILTEQGSGRINAILRFDPM